MPYADYQSLFREWQYLYAIDFKSIYRVSPVRLNHMKKARPVMPGQSARIYRHDSPDDETNMPACCPLIQVNL
jgi:hypothetical protein